jgi:cation transport ATPase
VTDCRKYNESITEAEVFELLGSAESSSEHPIAKAIVAKARELNCDLVQPQNFQVIFIRNNCISIHNTDHTWIWNFLQSE